MARPDTQTGTIMKLTKKENVFALFLSKPNAEKTSYGKLIIITYTNRHGVFCAAAFKHSHRPEFNYAYKNEQARNEHLAQRIKQEQEAEERDIVYLQKKQVEIEKFIPGAILVSSWGYEQTNIDFFLILERENDFVVIQEVGSHKEQTGFMSGVCTPNVDVKIGEPFRKKISKYATINIKSFIHTQLWSGNAMGYSSYA